jgi:hypothetical protein
MVMPTFGSLLVIIGDSLLYTRLYGGTGEPEDSPSGGHKKRALRRVPFSLPPPCRSRLAGDGISAVFQINRSDAFASKPAPTGWHQRGIQKNRSDAIASKPRKRQRLSLRFLSAFLWCDIIRRFLLT